MAAGVAGAARAGAGAWRGLGGVRWGLWVRAGERVWMARRSPVPLGGFCGQDGPPFGSHPTSQGKTRSPKAPVRIPARAGGGAPGEGRRECKLSGQSRPARQRLSGAEGGIGAPEWPDGVFIGGFCVVLRSFEGVLSAFGIIRCDDLILACLRTAEGRP